MKKLIVFLMVAGLVIAGSGQASADLLFDRGLPTANLNNAAGTYRSNVAWADWESSPPGPTSEYWLAGDDVVLTNPGIYHIDTVRVWTASDPATGLSLLAGSSPSNVGRFTSYAYSAVTYSDGTTYQGSSGAFMPLYQLDFAINEDVTSGKYYFFLDGPFAPYQGGGYVSPFVHASNSALSGSPQDGADDAFQFLHMDYGSVVAIESWYSGTGGGTTGWGPGWDKNSDANIQVYGTPVPEPGTLLLLGSGLLGLTSAGARKKFRK